MSQVGAPPPVAATPSTTATPDTSKGSTAPAVDSVSKPQDTTPVESKDGAAQKETKAEKQIKEEIRKMKLKINGQDVDLPEDEVKRRAQLYSGAEEKFRAAAEQRKQVETFVEALKKNPMAVLTHPELGLNFRELAEQYLVEQIQQEQMDPKERELEQLRKWKQEQEETKRAAEMEEMTKKERAAFEQQVQQARETYDRQIGEVLNQSGLPRNARTIKRVAELMHGALSKGYELPLEMAVDMVKESYTQDIKELVGNLGEEHFESILGDEFVGKLRKRDLARLKAKMKPSEATIPATPQPVQAQQTSKPTKSSQLNTHEWKEALRKKAGF